MTDISPSGDTPADAGAAVEVPLTGGRLTHGVVQVGETVRRPVSASSPFVAQLLRHLEQHGFAGAPRYLGVDEAGRDIFSYLPGTVPAKFQQWTDAQVGAAGVLLRRLHDGTRGSTLAGRFPVVCHHDPGPNNTVFLKDVPAAFIDFDTAAPGEPLEDVGYAAWTWTISARPDRGPVDVQAAQVRLLADAYGLDRHERQRLVAAILERQSRNARFWADRARSPSEPGPGMDVIQARVEWSRREHAFVCAHRAAFESVLG
ncbi:phosphotransferase [Streptomyces sp. NPDC047072]|uniref:phosphotransferase n=1 Tax=Streptomyces sp. NPDC047072 TaxID=3154809 RepID=UPI0033E27A18